MAKKASEFKEELIKKLEELIYQDKRVDQDEIAQVPLIKPPPAPLLLPPPPPRSRLGRCQICGGKVKKNTSICISCRSYGCLIS